MISSLARYQPISLFYWSPRQEVALQSNGKLGSRTGPRTEVSTLSNLYSFKAACTSPLVSCPPPSFRPLWPRSFQICATLSVVCGLLSAYMSRHFIASDIAMTSKDIIILWIIHFHYVLQGISSQRIENFFHWSFSIDSLKSPALDPFPSSGGGLSLLLIPLRFGKSSPWPT